MAASKRGHGGETDHMQERTQDRLAAQVTQEREEVMMKRAGM